MVRAILHPPPRTRKPLKHNDVKRGEMRVIRLHIDSMSHLRQCAVAIGNFDGLHPGHLAIIEEAKQQAKELSTKSAVLTFEPHPRTYLRDESPSSYRITPLKEKLRRIAQCGVEVIYIMRFERRLCTLPAPEFVSRVLHSSLRARCIITGDDFTFGSKRDGNTQILQEECAKYDIETHIVGKLRIGEMCYSSSMIREHIRAGNMTSANSIMIRDYAMEGRVRRGRRLARSLGTPTANIYPCGMLYPKHGVYAGIAAICNDGKYGAPMPVVMNIGLRPTVDEHTHPRLSVEVHFLETDTGDIYGRRIRVMPQHFIREERKFESLSALQAQILEDVKAAHKILHTHPVITKPPQELSPL